MRYANQLPQQVEQLIVDLKRAKPHWGARRIGELLIRKLAGDVRIPARSTVDAVLDRYSLVKRQRRGRAEGSPPQCWIQRPSTIARARVARGRRRWCDT